MPKFRRVTGLFRAAIPDGPDADYTPELEALNGQVEFVPRYRGGVIAYPHLDPPEFVRPEPIQAVLQDGRVMTQVSVGEETVIQPVELMVSDDDEATQSWQWEAVFRNIRVGRWGDEVSISPLRFTVPDEHGPLDLTEVVGEKSGGTITVKGPRGVGITSITAQDGVVTVKWEGGSDVEIPIPAAALATPTSDGLMPATDKAKLDGITAETSSGTRIFIGGITVFSDTGRRDIRDSGINPDTVSPGGVAWIVRQGREVTMSLYDVMLKSSGTVRVALTLPLGFRPVNREGYSVSIASDATVEAIVMGTGLYLYGVPSGSGYRIRATFKWITDDPWPTTLPGTPA